MNLIIIVPIIVTISIITFGILVKLLGAVPKKYHKSIQLMGSFGIVLIISGTFITYYKDQSEKMEKDKLQYADNILQSFENSDNKISAMNTLSKVYIHFKQFKEAKIYLDSATILLTEKTSNILEVDHLLTISDYYAAVNKNDSAYYYYKIYNNKKEELYQNVQKNQSVLLLAQMEIANRRDELLESNKSLFESNK